MAVDSLPAVQLTLAEAVTLPGMGYLDERQLTVIVRALRWRPGGVRRTGNGGRPAYTFDSGRLMRLSAALAPFCEDP